MFDSEQNSTNIGSNNSVDINVVAEPVEIGTRPPLNRPRSAGVAYLHQLLDCNFATHLPAVVYDDGLCNSSEVLTHANLKYFSERIFKLLAERLRLIKGIVGVALEQTCLLPIVLLGILKAGCGFYCVDSQSDFNEHICVISHLNIKYFIAEPEYKQKQPNLRKNLKSSVPYEYQTPDSRVINFHLHILQCKMEKLAVPMGSYEWAYAIKTSGTTGNTKIVLVSHSSIVPNIKDLKARWNLTFTDVFFGASPVTFDPHIVELFLALATNGKIVYVPRWFKLSPRLLTKVLLSHKITVLQCTPSLLLRFSRLELCKLFGIGSPLRVLALGGEPFVNMDYLRSVVPFGREDSLKIFNLYGVTEMSCWLSMTQIHFDDSAPQITTLLTDSGFSFCKEMNGDISLYATTVGRLCKVMRECNGEIIPIDVRQIGGFKTYFLPTGDIVETNIPGEPPCVIYKGRNDMRMKRFGRFVDLIEVENRTEATRLVNLALCFDYIGEIYLVVQLNDQAITVPTFLAKLRKYVDYRSYPDHVLLVSQVPLTRNGKIDVKRIKDAITRRVDDLTVDLPFENQFQVSYKDEDVIDMLKHEWDMFTNPPNSENHSPSYRGNFFQAGGDSMRALQYIETIFQELKLFGTSSQHELSPVMLNILSRKEYSDMESYVINHVCKTVQRSTGIWNLDSLLTEVNQVNSTLPKPKYRTVPHSAGILNLDSLLTEVHQINSSQPKNEVADESPPAIPTGSEAIPSTYAGIQVPITIRRHWKLNLYGCNDATPVIVEMIDALVLIITSNSGRVQAVNLQALNDLAPENAEKAAFWWRMLPDRIVCSAAVHPGKEFIIVSCCDGNLYAFKIRTGSVKWVYQHKSRAILRSAPVFSQDGTSLYLASEADLLLRLNFKNGTLIQEMYVEKIVGRLTPLLFFFPYGNPPVNLDSLFVTTYSGMKKIIPDPCMEEEEHIRSESNHISAVTVKLDTKDLVVYEQRAGILAAGFVQVPDGFLPGWEIELDPHELDPQLQSHINPPISHEIDLCYPKHLIICTTTDGKFYVIDAEVGKVLNVLDLEGETNSTPTIVRTDKDKLLVVVSMRKEGLKFVQVNFPVEPDSTEFRLEIVGTLKVDGKDVECFSSVAVYRNALIFGSRDDYVHVIELV